MLTELPTHPVAELFKTKQQVELLRLFVESDCNVAYTEDELYEKMSDYKNNITQIDIDNIEPIDSLVDIGIVEQINEGEDVCYQRSESPLIEFLSQHNMYHLYNLFNSETKRRLTVFLLDRADPNQGYTPYWFEQNLDQRGEFDENISTLMTCGMVEKTRESDTIKYSVDVSSVLYTRLYALNMLVQKSMQMTRGRRSQTTRLKPSQRPQA